MTQTDAKMQAEDGNMLILSSRVIGTGVFDRAGKRLGHVDDLSIEKAGGRSVYAIMSFGGVFGIGERFHPVPWDLLDFDPAIGGFVVDLEESVLRNAPHYDRDELRALGGAAYRRYGEEVFAYYGP